MHQSASLMAAIEPDLHIAFFPWLAFGHIMPFLDLATRLSQRGYRISFISTPNNLQRLSLPKLPPNFTLIPIPLTPVSGLPESAESTADVSNPHQGLLLRTAFDALKTPVLNFLHHHRPDWLIHDFASHWLPSAAGELRIPCAYFNIFNASSVAFYGPIEEMLRDQDHRSRVTPEDYVIPPKWITFPSNHALRTHESRRFFTKRVGSADKDGNVYRLGIVIRDSDLMLVRTCPEFEGEWLSLLELELGMTRVMPVGLLPPPTAHDSEDDDERWLEIKNWLDNQERSSVVYVALGSEAILSQDEVKELARGLELAKLPFFWVLRNPKPPGLESGELEMSLPEGFKDRVKGRGVVWTSWAYQLKILAHPAVGGFLTHCGWSSVIEGLALGLGLVLLPMTVMQALNARVLEGKKIGLEIPRNELDGSLRGESVAESLRTVMVEQRGEVFRAKAKEMKGLFGDKDRHERYVDDFVRFLKEHSGRINGCIKV